jgi:hypothetical protein
MQRLPAPAWGDLYAVTKAAATSAGLVTGIPQGMSVPEKSKSLPLAEARADAGQHAPPPQV